jgi:hypothetical protein
MSVFMLSDTFFIVMLNVIMLSVLILIGIMMNVLASSYVFVFDKKNLV